MELRPNPIEARFSLLNELNYGFRSATPFSRYYLKRRDSQTTRSVLSFDISYDMTLNLNTKEGKH